MASNIINVDFRKPHNRYIQKADAAAMAGQVEKALELYETAVEQDPNSWDAGFAYARYLWQNRCWRPSLRECWRLLALHPEMEKIYGLIYRNLLAMGQEDNARFAYERYMLHLYHNPEDGLNLGEENPPIPPAPAKKRFKHILYRIGQYILHKKLDKASRLMAYACRPTFPEESNLRDMLQVELLAAYGLYAEAQQMIDEILEKETFSAFEAIGLLKVQENILKALEVENDESVAVYSKLIHYACARVYTPLDVCQVTSLMIHMGNAGKWSEHLELMLEEEPYRVDLLYQLAVCCFLDGDAESAMDYLDLCSLLDPYDTDINYFGTMLENWLENQTDESKLEEIPISLQYSPFSMNRAAAQMMLASSLMSKTPQDIAEKFSPLTESNMLMDGLCDMPDDLAKQVLEAVSTMPFDQQEVFLRRMLVSGSWNKEMLEDMLVMLSDIGVGERVPVMHGHVLKMRAYPEKI